MRSLTTETDVPAMRVTVEDSRLVVELMDGRTVAVPLAWYHRLANATLQQRKTIGGWRAVVTVPIGQKLMRT